MLEEWLKPAGAAIAAILGALGIVKIARQRDQERLAELEDAHEDCVKHPELTACITRIEGSLTGLTAEMRTQHGAIYQLIRERDDNRAQEEKRVAERLGELTGAVKSLEKRVR